MPKVAVASIPGDTARENEDAVALGDGVAVVVDGAGLPKELRRGCRHSVRWYAGNLARAFRDHLVRLDSEMPDALAAAISDVAASHSVDCRPEEGSPSATVAAWRAHEDSVEYLVLCDASVVLAFRDGSVAEVTDDRISRATQPVIDQFLRDVSRNSGVITTDDKRSARLAAVEQTRNREGGFWCCHTDPAAAFAAIHDRTDRDILRAVVAASDGATRGYQVLGIHTPAALTSAAGSDDLTALIASIRDAEERNGVLVQQAIKQHDDATIVAATFDHD